jgi:uncharacterized protein (TIGR02145 family)
MNCTKCNTALMANAKFCQRCGATQEKHDKTCPNNSCKRTDLPEDALFCPYCGIKLSWGIDIFTDIRDGKQYKCVKIGTQLWMAQNLAFKVNGGCWAYNNDESNVEKYGYLYDWEIAKKACPDGWHLPSDREWKQLEEHLGMSLLDTNKTGWRGNIGEELKSKNGWFSGGNGSNSSGFNALPGGYRYSDGSFNNVGKNAYFWSSSAKGSEHAWFRELFYFSVEVFRYSWYRTNAYSVRCLQDNPDI